MKLWLVCFLILFFGAEAFQWLGEVPWVSSVELSLPLTVLGGIGLAIASNHRQWIDLTALVNDRTQGAIAPNLDLLDPDNAPLAAVQPPEPKAKSAQPSQKPNSISFEIKKRG